MVSCYTAVGGDKKHEQLYSSIVMPIDFVLFFKNLMYISVKGKGNKLTNCIGKVQ